MYILGIETSSDVGSVALLSENDLIESICFGDSGAHARHLLTSVHKLLLNAGIDKKEVELVAVSVGPGSFTGLRVGITCAKTLAYSLGWNAVGVCSLEVMAQNILIDDVSCEYICPLRDARRNAVYGRIFARGASGWSPQSEVMIDSPPRLAESLPEDVLVFGSGLAAYPDVFTSHSFHHPDDNAKVSGGSALCTARLGYRKARAGECASPMELVPKYYRLTEIEERVKGRGGSAGSGR